MRGSRLLLIVGVILIVGAIAVGAIFLLGGGGREGPEEVAGTPTPVPEVPKVDVVVAAQDIPRGVQITEEMTVGEAPAVTIESRTEDEVPDGAITRVEDVIGRTSRVDIVRDSLILASMLVEEPPGSSAALQIPEEGEFVAYALPVARYSSVAWALQPGDHVDMIISLLVVDLDEEFQSVQPSQARCLSPSEDPACAGMSGPMGRLEVMPNGWLVNLTPSESQRPRLVTQMTIQDALVLRVGDWPIMGEEPGPPVPEPAPPPAPAEGEEGEGAAEPEAPVAPLVAPLTLAVSRQDALVLDYAQLMGAHITFVLRRTGDAARVTTESVTLQYLMDRFNIELPPKLPYGADPRVLGLDTISRAEASAYQPPSGEPEQ